ncbi:MAG: response regulator [Pseudomonadota bacterium]
MKRILAVDDSASMLNMLSDCLRGAGHEVVEASDGREALERLRETQPDMVITDLTMPNMDGLDFIDAARSEEAGRRLPMLLLTTETADHMKQRAREIGATGWLTKPFDPDQVLRLVDQLA